MLSCPKCGVRIRGNKASCPLCGGRVQGEAEPSPFPYIPESRISLLTVIRLSTFIILAVEIVLFAVHFLTDFRFQILSLCMLGALAVWIDIFMTVKYRRSLIRMLSLQVYFGCAATVIIDILTRYRGWSVAWVIPLSLTGLVIATVCIGKGRKMLLEEYIIYLAADMLLSFLQIIPLLMGLNPFRFPAVISMAFMLISGLAALLFFRRDLKSASSKLFHI